jgi:hypothetical protein
MDTLIFQTDPDYEQILIEDKEGLGVGHANRQLATARPTGEYVMVLDDDDWLLHDDAIGLMKNATVEGPSLLIFKADHNGLGILPSPAVWQRRPMQGHIGSCDFITRQDVWSRHINAFGVNACGDYAFLFSIWQDNPSVVWLDEILAGVQRISRGAPE